jgi:hypothetical protein
MLACIGYIVCCRPNTASCIARLQLTLNVAQQTCRPRRWQGVGAMLHYIQCHWKQSGQAPMLDGVHTACCTGSVKRSSAVFALRTLCRQRRHMRMRVPRKSHFMYTSIKSCCVRTARSIAVSSLFRRGLQLVNFIIFFMCRRLDAAAITQRAIGLRRDVAQKGVPSCAAV